IELIRRHVLAAERLHGDDTTVPVLAKDKTVIGRVWAYVRDDRPFAGPDPPAALFFYSRNRNGEHPKPASRRLCRDPPGRCWRLSSGQPTAGPGGRFWRSLRSPAPARPDLRGGLLEPWPAQILRAGRSRQIAARRRSGAPHRRDLRDRARDQWYRRRAAARGPRGTDQATGRRA